MRTTETIKTGDLVHIPAGTYILHGTEELKRPVIGIFVKSFFDFGRIWYLVFSDKIYKSSNICKYEGK